MKLKVVQFIYGQFLDAITRQFPSHGILAEEGGDIKNSHEAYRWVIDPLDGTTNFAIGLPLFCISIALQYQNKTLLGVVYAPYLDELFYATKEGGAFLNDKRLHVASNTALSHCVVSTGFPYNKATSPDNNLDNITQILPKVRGLRRFGAAAYDISLVAAGILDGYWEANLQLWDMAAGELFVKEAGGKVHYFRDDNSYSIVCGNPTVVGLINNEIT